MKKLLRIGLILFLVVSFMACSEDEEPDTNQVAVYDVYTCGMAVADVFNQFDYYKNGTAMRIGDLTSDVSIAAVTVVDGHVYFAGEKDYKAMYWKDGVEFALTDATNATTIFDIFVSGPDVYVSGRMRNSAGDDIPTYWKNGNPVTNAGSSFIDSIAVLGSDVYCLVNSGSSGGSELYKNGVIQSITNADSLHSVYVSGVDVYVVGKDNNSKAACWNNGEEYVLTGGTEAYSMVISGSDYFAVGVDGAAIVYWHNSTVVTLHDGVGIDYMYNLDLAVSGTNVHVVGYWDNSDGDYVSKYWINGVEQSLFNLQFNNKADDICIAGSDVYITGEFASGEDWDALVAKYWKNGVGYPLTDGTHSANAYSIFASGSDVYVAGVESNNNDVSVAKYWKNGVAYLLTDGTNTAYALSIFVSGSDVYVAGYEDNDSAVFVAKYWKNSIAYPLTLGTYSAGAYSVFVSGPDVYVAGREDNASDVSVAKYWKNGVSYPLTDGTYSAGAYSVFVTGTNVYVAGFESNASDVRIAKYWKNGTAYPLTAGINNSYAASISVDGTNVFVAGKQSAAYLDVLTYWKNGVAQDIATGNDLFSVGLAVVDDNAYITGYYEDEYSIANYWYNSASDQVFVGDGQRLSYVNGIFVVKQ